MHRGLLSHPPNPKAGRLVRWPPRPGRPRPGRCLPAPVAGGRAPRRTMSPGPGPRATAAATDPDALRPTGCRRSCVRRPPRCAGRRLPPSSPDTPAHPPSGHRRRLCSAVVHRHPGAPVTQTIHCCSLTRPSRPVEHPGPRCMSFAERRTDRDRRPQPPRAAASPQAVPVTERVFDADGPRYAGCRRNLNVPPDGCAGACGRSGT
jgi:hypothetical protein